MLYGMTYTGGQAPNYYGTFFRYDPVSNKDTVLQNYIGTNGENPYGNVIQTKDGLLYGTTAYGGTHAGRPQGGLIFRYNTVTGQDTILYDLDAYTLDANVIYGSLLAVSNGLFYGISYLGDTTGIGTIFSFNPSTFVETPLINMRKRTIGANSTSSFIQATNGLLYASTDANTTGYGTIFSYNTDRDSAVLLHVFAGAPNDGNYPRGGPIQDTNGLLYGLTMMGGTYNLGILYSYNITTKVETVLVNFNDTNGANPQQSLLQASDGKLYGTTVAGGTQDSGTLFSYDIATNAITTLVSFTGPIGTCPYGNLIQATDGQLYGMTNIGGTYNNGTIFSYNIITNVEKVLFNFNNNNGGALPYEDLLEAMSISDLVTNNTCPNGNSGEIAISVRGGKAPLTYKWNTGATTSNMTNLTSGVYSYTVTDSRGIAFSRTDTIKPLPIILNFNVSNSCSGGNTGGASVNVSGGIGPFTYSWSNGSTTDTAFDLATGTYTCSITDSNGCPAISTVLITQAAPLVIDSIVTVKQTYPYNNGIVTAYASGGIPPGDSVYYLYLWNNGGSSNDSITNLDSGHYAVCVTSPYGCGTVCDSDIIILAGIKNINSPGQIVAYPVPSSGLITVLLKGDGFENLEVTDVLGRPVYQQLLSSASKDNTLYIDLGGQADGVYILHVNSQQGIFTKKIIIQK